MSNSNTPVGVGVGVDRISNLPNDILCRILTLLPTKFAFTTIVLSKRWTSLLNHSLTDLYFDDESVRDKQSFLRFLQFVDTITLSNKLIKTIHFNCGSRHWHDTTFNVDRWIETAKQHPVINLQIFSKFHKINLPPTIFNFPSLVVLKLTTLKVVDAVNINYVNLPLLKTLHLYNFYFKSLYNFKNLIFGCPILEDLNADVFYLDDVDRITVGFRSEEEQEFKPLSNLITAKINAFDVTFKAIYNVQTLELKINTMLPKPEMNSYYISFLVFKNLVHLELFFTAFYAVDDVLELLHNCPSLQILSILKWAANPCLFRNWKYPNFVPKCISSHLRSYTINYEGFVDELRLATYILQNAPLLEFMKIIITGTLRSQDALKELSSYPRISPKCELSIGYI